MEKSVDAFRTISEVAEDLALPQHVLRFWETRFPQIKPMKRAGGRRYYRPADIDLLKIIRQLLYEEGFTIKGVQKLIKEQGTRAMREGHLPMPVDLAQIDAGSTVPDDDADLAADLAADAPMTRDEPSGARDAPLPASIRAALVPTGPTNEGIRLSRRDLRDLREALGTIDECTRILDALRKPR